MINTLTYLRELPVMLNIDNWTSTDGKIHSDFFTFNKDGNL